MPDATASPAALIDTCAAMHLEMHPDTALTRKVADGFWFLISAEQRDLFDGPDDFHVCLEMRVDDRRKVAS